MQKDNLAALMKAGMRQLASGVCVLSARINADERFAMTVSSVTSVSDDPASLLVCINLNVSQAQVLSTQGSVFAVNVLADTHQAISNLCAGRHPEQDRFSIGDWSEADGVPFLTDALATFVCVADQIMVYGTHAIVVARITGGAVADSQQSPLLYAQGRYGAFA